MSINSNKALLEANVMLLNVQVARKSEVSQRADGQNHPQGWGGEKRRAASWSDHYITDELISLRPLRMNHL